MVFLLLFCKNNINYNKNIENSNKAIENCKRCFDANIKKKLSVKGFILEVPTPYNLVRDKILQDSFTGKIVCNFCENTYISFDCGQYEWDNFPDSEESFIKSEKWYEHEPLEKTNFTILKCNDSIKKVFPNCDYYAIDSISKNAYPKKISHEVRNYNFIHNNTKFTTKIAYSILPDKDKKYQVWLECMKLYDKSTKDFCHVLSLYSSCNSEKERDLMIAIYKTVNLEAR